MAATGEQPVSASNLSAALGASAGSGLTGSEPISVDNLKAALEAFGSPDGVVLFLDKSGSESGLLNDSVSNYGEVMYLRYTPFSGEMYLTSFGDVSGGSFNDGVVSISGRAFTVNQLNYTVVLIIGRK